MCLPRRFRFILPAALRAAAIAPATAQTVVKRIAVSTGGPFEFKVQTSAKVSPQSQVIANPFRLVIDVPGAVPGPALRGQAVNRGGVERLRVGLFSSSPATTRI